MSAVRIKLTGQKATFHLIGRIVGAERLLDDAGKEALTRMLWKMAAFCGMEVITYCMMANHFHVLIRVPEPPQLTDGQLIERLEALYGARGAPTLLAREAMSERGKIDEDIRRKLVERMGDVSAFKGKLKLIVTGFGEAAIAVNVAKTRIDPHAKVFPGHSSEMTSQAESMVMI